MKIHNIIFAALLTVGPLATALAQGNTGPGTKAESTTESTAMKNGFATNPHQAGATGATVVPGDKSTVAGDHKATVETKTGGVAGGK